MSSRSWLCTFNLDKEDSANWEEILARFYSLLGARYVCGQLEKGEATHHFHIQFYVNFEKPQRISCFKKANKGIHAEKCKSEEASIKYCMKEVTRIEGPKEFGKKPFHTNSKKDWDDIWNKAKAGEIEKIDSSIRVMHYNKLKAIAKDYMKFEDKNHLRGIWVWGKAGEGKSRWVREQAKIWNKPLYSKLCNKWWDGYQGEEIVVMDDIGINHECLAQQLKIWADRYDCILENKGGACHSNYEWFIITSQYAPWEIFKDKDLEAIERRFQIYNIKDILLLNLTILGINSVFNI